MALDAIVDRWRAGGLRRLLGDGPLLVRQTIRFVTGAPPLPHAAPARLDLVVEPPFDSWVRCNAFSDRDADELRLRLKECGGPLPLLSVVMPVYNADIALLDSAIESVVGQIYENWELCVADDASNDSVVRERLNRWRSTDPRIRVTFRPERGNISLCSNDAAALARGEFLVLLDQDDELTPDALAEVALSLASAPDADVLYSDDDKVDVGGHRYDAQFKADWSPELLLSYMYFSHLLVLRRTLFEAIGGFRAGFEGSQDHDLALRAVEHARSVRHVPQILYHWRASPGSLAHAPTAKPASIAAGQRAVQDALDRRRMAARARQPAWAAAAGLGIFEPRFADEGPEVTIIIPTRDADGRLRRCLSSLNRTSYKSARVLVLDNQPGTPAKAHTLKWPVDSVKCEQERFNFSALINLGVRLARSRFVLFLNDDIEVLDPSWLSQMMGYAQSDGVGAVGAKLVYPDGRVQHAGVVHGYHHGLAGHAFKLLDQNDPGYLWQAGVARNCSAVSAACLLTTRELVQSVGGFDERDFAVAYNDADFCYRLAELGRRIVYCPVALRHVESASRGYVDNPAERAHFRAKYRSRRDVYHSPHLSLESENFAIQPRRLLRSTPRRGDLALFGNAFDLTGAPLHQLELVRAFPETGFGLAWAHANAPGPLQQRYDAMGLGDVTTGHPLSQVAADLRRYDEAVDRIARDLASRSIDVVYANTFETFYAIDAAHRAGVPAVWNIHESEPTDWYFSHFGPAIHRRALECFAHPYRVVFVADSTREVHAHLNSRHNFTVIRNGLDLRRLPPESPSADCIDVRGALGATGSDCVILQVGTVCDRKSQLDLVEAVAQLPSEVSSRVVCVIVGDRPGPYSDRLHQRVAELTRAGTLRIRIVTETPETDPYYRAADVFACTSRVESYPRVILEAMAYGLPIVTTPVFGIREQVQEGINGLFFETGDQQALARHLRSLVTDRDRRQSMARCSGDVLAGLTSFQEMVDAYVMLFQEAMYTTAARRSNQDGVSSARYASATTPGSPIL